MWLILLIFDVTEVNVDILRNNTISGIGEQIVGLLHKMICNNKKGK